MFKELIHKIYSKYYIPESLNYVIGGHCGICGKWLPDAKVEEGWKWTVCSVCLGE